MVLYRAATGVLCFRDCTQSLMTSCYSENWKTQAGNNLFAWSERGRKESGGRALGCRDRLEHGRRPSFARSRRARQGSGGGACRASPSRHAAPARRPCSGRWSPMSPGRHDLAPVAALVRLQRRRPRSSTPHRALGLTRTDMRAPDAGERATYRGLPAGMTPLLRPLVSEIGGRRRRRRPHPPLPTELVNRVVPWPAAGQLCARG
jgi:hypothetical protein